MYSDGYVRKDKNGYFTSSIKIHKKDEKVLDLFSDITNWRRTYEKDYVIIRCFRKEFVEELLEIGCLSRKSYENSEKLIIPNINREYYPYFIRGIFDGDGYYSKMGASIECGVGNRNENLLKGIQKYLSENNIESKLEFNLNKGSGLYRLRVRKNSEVKKFIDLIFADNLDLVLERKYLIVKAFLDSYKTVSEICRDKAKGRKQSEETLEKRRKAMLKHFAQLKSGGLLEHLKGQSATK